MTSPFIYPSTPHVRRHGPAGYADSTGYRPWLRDEFSFRCVYCLMREQWGRMGGTFEIDLISYPSSIVPIWPPSTTTLYTFAELRNPAKRELAIPDPLMTLSSRHRPSFLRMGKLHTENPDAACLIEILGLDAEDAVEFRMSWGRHHRPSKCKQSDPVSQIPWGIPDVIFQICSGLGLPAQNTPPRWRRRVLSCAA